jgi:hypothetical protein
MEIVDMNYKIIDNFLPENEFNIVKEFMLGPNIEWAYNSFIVDPASKLPDYFGNYQFTHTFYAYSMLKSNKIEILDPILRRINPSAIVRIKANLQPRAETIFTHQYHLDHNHFSGKVAIFYVNSNDGYTIFEDGTKIDSVENRLLMFDGDVLHTGTTCTNQKVRCLINFMFYQWTDATI